MQKWRKTGTPLFHCYKKADFNSTIHQLEQNPFQAMTSISGDPGWSWHQRAEHPMAALTDWHCGAGACAVCHHHCWEHTLRPTRSLHGGHYQRSQGGQCLQIHHGPATGCSFLDLEVQHGTFSILSSPLAWWIWIFWNLTEIRHLGRGGWRSDERWSEAAHRHRSCSGQESPDPAAGHGNVCPWQREWGYSSRSSG